MIVDIFSRFNKGQKVTKLSGGPQKNPQRPGLQSKTGLLSCGNNEVCSPFRHEKSPADRLAFCFQCHFSIQLRHDSRCWSNHCCCALPTENMRGNGWGGIKAGGTSHPDRLSGAGNAVLLQAVSSHISKRSGAVYEQIQTTNWRVTQFTLTFCEKI